MRRRYFSPELRETLNYLHENSKQKLRWVGSTAKLSTSTGFMEENEEKIGSYVFYRDKEIGCGYSSKVYKARKVGEDKDYAIKVI